MHIESWCDHDGVLDDICYCYLLLDFKCIFQLYSSGFSVSWYGYRYHVPLCIGQLHPSQSIGVVLGYVLFWCWVSLGVHFTNSLIEFYFIMIVVIDLLFNKTLHSQVAVSDSNGIQNKITDGRDWTYIWFRADGSTLIWFCISFDLDTTCTIVAVRLLLSGCEGFLAS